MSEVVTNRPVRSLAMDADTRLMGVLGEHIAYTQSPRLHSRAAALLGVNAVYLSLSMPQADVRSFLDIAWRLGALGFNVTTPHKQYVASLFPEAGLQSVNTLYRGEHGWQAASTDAAGFAAAIERLGRPLDSFSKLIFLGAGGATIAILEHLAKLASPPAEVIIARRNAARDADLRRTLRNLPTHLSFIEASPVVLQGVLAGRGDDTLLIQATNAPQHGDDLAAFVPALANYAGAFVDLVYGKPSALYFHAVARDLLVQDGESMLIEQARLSQRLWWGRSASYEAMADALRGR